MLEYVKRFGEKAGNMPMAVCAVNVIVENSAGEILLQFTMIINAGHILARP